MLQLTTRDDFKTGKRFTILCNNRDIRIEVPINYTYL